MTAEVTHPVKSAKGSVALVQGVFLGLVWLWPVYVPPGVGISPLLLPDWRAERMVFMALVLLFPILLGMRMPKATLFRPEFAFFALLFVITPLVSCVLFGSSRMQMMYGVLPLLLTFLSILALSYHTKDSIKKFFFGVGGVSLLLVLFRLLTYGLETTTYYWRSRAHFGFNHPIDSTSAFVAMATMFMAFLTFRRSSKNLFVGSLIAVSIWGVILAGSRNFIVHLAITCAGAFILRSLRNQRFCRVFLFCSLGFFPVVAKLFFVFSDMNYFAYWIVKNRETSLAARLEDILHFRQIVRVAGSESFWQYFNIPKTGFMRGFAAYDSVYLSYWHHFGLLGIICFVFGWFGIGVAFSLKSQRLNTFSCWCAGSWLGLSYFYSFDGQGLTLPNLSLVLPFAWAFNAAADEHRRYPVLLRERKYS